MIKENERLFDPTNYQMTEFMNGQAWLFNPTPAADRIYGMTWWWRFGVSKSELPTFMVYLDIADQLECDNEDCAVFSCKRKATGKPMQIGRIQLFGRVPSGLTLVADEAQPNYADFVKLFKTVYDRDVAPTMTNTLNKGEEESETNAQSRSGEHTTVKRLQSLQNELRWFHDTWGDTWGCMEEYSYHNLVNTVGHIIKEEGKSK